MTSLFDLLLAVHITAGFTALSAAAGAILTKKGMTIHRYCGRIFLFAMTGIFLTSIPMSLIKKDLFLLLIALFSYYFAISGWVYAKNRTGIASRLAWALAFMMLIVACTMLVTSLRTSDASYQPTVLMVFGILGCMISLSDIKMFYGHKATGNMRIIKHFSAMLGATIAASTAFTVVNVQTHPAYIAWLAPTFIIVPFILWWRWRLTRAPL